MANHRRAEDLNHADLHHLASHQEILEILETLKSKLQEERRALEELDLERLHAMNEEMPAVFDQLRKLMAVREPEDANTEAENGTVADEKTTYEAPPLNLTPEVRALMGEVKNLRKENLEISQKINGALKEELQRLEQGEKALRAYQSRDGANTGRPSFIKKKV